MAKFIQQTFSNQKLELDGNEYERCVFNDCVFTYRGGAHFLIDDGSMDRCNLEIVAEAANTLMALASLCKTPLRESVKGLLAGSLGDALKEQS